MVKKVVIDEISIKVNNPQSSSKSSSVGNVDEIVASIKSSKWSKKSSRGKVVKKMRHRVVARQNGVKIVKIVIVKNRRA
jgi:hypothetical protein